MKLIKCLLFTLLLGITVTPSVKADDSSPVSLREDDSSYTLDNGIVKAVVAKKSGKLSSVEYSGVEAITAGTWSHSPSRNVTTSVTIDPRSNNGTMAEVSVNSDCGGSAQGSGPGGGTICDIEVRYALQQGSSGLYTYSIFTHKPEYPDTDIGEARFYIRLNDDVFDWMTVDANRNMEMITASDWNHGIPQNMKEARLMTTGIDKGQVEHKYDYSANQFEVLAWGWSSTEKKIGCWFVNPTDEYLSGGPTKYELSAHRDATFGTDLSAPAPPILLNYWRGSHYGGSSAASAQGEYWTKVIGPFLIYFNSGADHDGLWQDALAQAKKEADLWPYDWVAGVDYPHKSERSTVTGQMVINDPGAAPDNKISNLIVGLSYPDYLPNGKPTGRGPGGVITWQEDAKHYEFWVHADDQGHFSIPNVRAGNYTLHAIANGVLGDFSQTGVTVESGKPLDLGTVQWQPVRYGKQLWDIGIPNRDASEFLHGDNYWHWGLYLQYPTDFPNDVNFVIGKSDYHKDWNYAQVPRPDRPDGTPWTITFDLPNDEQGKAILRLAVAGASSKPLDVKVNDRDLGTVKDLVDNGSIRRDLVAGYWTEHDVIFDADLLRSGTNTIVLTTPSANPFYGIEYDYIRLEVDESGTGPLPPNSLLKGGTGSEDNSEN
jgi:rhamnogalacturonan endolyase